jgi:hypothetical protein
LVKKEKLQTGENVKSQLAEKPSNLTTFNTIKAGDVFEHNFDVFLKTSTTSNGSTSCVLLTTGQILTFNDGAKVIPRIDVFVGSEKIVTKMVE